MRDLGHTRGMAFESTVGRRHRKKRRMLSRLAVSALVLAGLGVQNSSAAEDPRYPGLPDFSSTSGDWVSPQGTGLTYADRAQQWVRLPPVYLGTFNRFAKTRTDNRCQLYTPYSMTEEYHATAFFLSSSGAPEPWGYVGPFTVRTVAFGSIPVEASIELRQPRDDENLPIGIEIKQKNGLYCAGKSPYPDIAVPGGVTRNSHYDPASVDGQVEVGVTALKVDGVDVDLRGTCRTSKPGALALTSREYFTMSPDNLEPGVQTTPENFMTTPYLNIANGGLLFGTADIPPFAGCVTATGEDVSQLLTATVSGPGNPVSMRTNGLVKSCMNRDVCPPPLPDLPFPASE